MENKKIERSSEQEVYPKPEGRKVLIVEEDLSDMNLSSRDLRLILEKLNQLHLEGKVMTIKATRTMCART